MTLKYVIFNDCLPLLFGEWFKHSDTATGRLGIPTSAGFCYRKDDGTWFAYGESISLGLKSTPDDSKTLTNAFSPELQ